MEKKTASLLNLEKLKKFVLQMRRKIEARNVAFAHEFCCYEEDKRTLRLNYTKITTDDAQLLASILLDLRGTIDSIFIVRSQLNDRRIKPLSIVIHSDGERTESETTECLQETPEAKVTHHLQYPYDPDIRYPRWTEDPHIS